nr:MAG TPA: actin related protein 1 [Caudoviricetes sp.]
MNIPEPTEREYLLQIERLLRNACMCRTDAQWLAFVRGEIEKKLEQLAAMRERKEREKQERKAKGRRGEA